jgi:uncharacterized protein YktB (UPF0637 family)
MSEAARLNKSLKEIDKNLTALEERFESLDHPRAQAILNYEMSKDKIAQYAGDNSSLKKSQLIYGNINDRLKDIHKSLKELEDMVLYYISKGKK